MAKFYLTARVYFLRNKGRGPCSWQSEIRVYLNDDTLVASALVTGKATPEWALKELRRNPGVFQKGPGFEMYQAMQRAACFVA